MATASVTNTLLNGTDTDADLVNANFNDLVTFLNASVLHVDGSKALTGNLSVGNNRITGLASPSASTDAATKAYADAVQPPGAIVAYAGSSAPSGWALCDGSSYATATYPNTFGVCGYTYGGAGANFNVPNLKGKVVVGLNAADGSFDTLAETGGSKDATVVTHGHTASASSDATPTAAFGYDVVRRYPSYGTALYSVPFDADADGNTPGGDTGGMAVSAGDTGIHDHAVTTTVTVNDSGSSGTNANLQPYMVLNYIIRMA